MDITYSQCENEDIVTADEITDMSNDEIERGVTQISPIYVSDTEEMDTDLNESEVVIQRPALNDNESTESRIPDVGDVEYNMNY